MLKKNKVTVFETSVNGKWILTGEHAVIRGFPALLFPVSSKTLKLTYTPSQDSLSIHYQGEYKDKLDLAFKSALSKSSELLKINLNELTGKIFISNQIPVGAGMGASGALCVAVGELLTHLGYLQKDDLFNFAKSLEDLFHGQSSGADIAIAIAKRGISFTNNGHIEPITMNWQPLWFLSYTGKASITSTSVNKVQSLCTTNESLAKKLDLDMAKSVTMAKKALLLSEQAGFALLKDAINLAHCCYQQWGLCDNDINRHADTLKNAGAKALKSTGAGGGGYMLSLWDEKPCDEIIQKLIPLNH